MTFRVISAKLSMLRLPLSHFGHKAFNQDEKSIFQGENSQLQVG